MTPGSTPRELLPEAVQRVLGEFARGVNLDVHLWVTPESDSAIHLFPPGPNTRPGPDPNAVVLSVSTRGGGEFVLEARGSLDLTQRAMVGVLRTTLEHLYESAEEIRFFTWEVSERYEEINLLYSIAETLGSLLRMKDAARLILSDICDVIGARSGAIWVKVDSPETLRLEAVFGSDPVGARAEEEGAGEQGAGDKGAGEKGNGTIPRTYRPITRQVLQEGRAMILHPEGWASADAVGTGSTGMGAGGIGAGGVGPGGGGSGSRRAPGGDTPGSILSVPIRYTPPSGTPETVGVIELEGSRRGGRFSAADQKLLSAIASQLGAALENQRLLKESLEQERVQREMELAHDLQMKLLPAIDGYDPVRIAARVEPAESVGGDFYHFFRLPEGRFGVMIGDVSSHGFPAALIMALAVSAATIYASEMESPEQVLRRMGEALGDELESTEMYLTLFYGVLDPERKALVYANAGHPHAFLLSPGGTNTRLLAMDPPMGIADPQTFQVGEVPWEPGSDVLLLFTDGLSDPIRADSRIEGEAAVVETVARLLHEPAREIVRAVFDLHRQGDQADGDDRTAVVLRL
jgi:phosphoserine phosphatase RsbU/P